MIPFVDVTDPTEARTTDLKGLDRALVCMIRDPRDLPFAHLQIAALITVIPSALCVFAFRQYSLWLGIAHLALVFGVYFDRFILMLHNICHRPFLKTEHRSLGLIVPWILSPFLGQTPHTYYCHHITMHHVEGNLVGDLSSTMGYRRDSVVDFARYFLRFFFLIIVELPRYFYRKHHYKLVVRALGGELAFWALVALSAVWNYRAALMVFVVPLVIARFLMMAGNWAQHAFVDPTDSANPYRNSITCINTRYNRRCFNDGYHIGHHLQPRLHWTEMPRNFQATLSEYAEGGAIVFSGIDYFEVWFWLMLKRLKPLARAFVPLSDRTRSMSEIEALLASRLGAI
jgi:fatty acid desaturase